MNAILVLHGLPYDLTASVIAHEATHAYLKLNESFPDDLPLKVRRSHLLSQMKEMISNDARTIDRRRRLSADQLPMAEVSPCTAGNRPCVS